MKNRDYNSNAKKSANLFSGIVCVGLIGLIVFVIGWGVLYSTHIFPYLPHP